MLMVEKWAGGLLHKPQIPLFLSLEVFIQQPSDWQKMPFRKGFQWGQSFIMNFDFNEGAGSCDAGV